MHSLVVFFIYTIVILWCKLDNCVSYLGSLYRVSIDMFQRAYD